MFTDFKTVFATFSTLILTGFLSSQVYAASVSVNPENLTFPEVCPGYSVTEDVTLTNMTGRTIPISIWIQDNTWDQFDIVAPEPLPDSMGPYGDPSGELTLTIKFTPPFDSMISGLLNIKVTDQEDDIAWVSLLGAGYCPICNNPEQLCLGACVNTLIDPNHCGACDYACPEGAPCADGDCQLNCGELTDCNDTCVDISTDPENCGECGNICSADETCTDGLCQLDCGELTACGETCVDISVNPNNCGACGYVCPGAETGTASCEAGVCGFSECAPGTVDVTHCSDIGGRVCAIDIYHYAVAEQEAGNIYPVNSTPSAVNRYDHFMSSLARVQENLLACRIDAACGGLLYLVEAVDGRNPDDCPTSDGCRGGAVPDAVAGPSKSALSRYIYVQHYESPICARTP